MNTINDDEISKKEVRILLSAPVYNEDRFAGWQDGAPA
jgi:hypothetical protein